MAYRQSFESCPRCRVGLADAGSVRGCARCGGQWVVEPVLAEMVIAMRSLGSFALLPRVARGAVSACPSCGDEMEAVSLYAVVELERCAKGHGVWFDPTELERGLRLAGDPAQQRDVMSAPTFASHELHARDPLSLLVESVPRVGDAELIEAPPLPAPAPPPPPEPPAPEPPPPPPEPEPVRVATPRPSVDPKVLAQFINRMKWGGKHFRSNTGNTGRTYEQIGWDREANQFYWADCQDGRGEEVYIDESRLSELLATKSFE